MVSVQDESEGDEWLPDDTPIKKAVQPKKKGPREKLIKRTAKRLAAAKVNIPLEDEDDWLRADWSMQLVKCYIGPKGNKCYSKQQVF